MKKLIPFIFLTLAACSSVPPPPVVNTVPLQISVPQLPAKLDMLDVQWQVLTKDELQKLLDTNKAATTAPNGQNVPQEPLVFFALTAQYYQNLSLNMAEFKRYILQEQDVIRYYITLTAPKPQEPPKPVEPPAEKSFWQKLFD